RRKERAQLIWVHAAFGEVDLDDVLVLRLHALEREFFDSHGDTSVGYAFAVHEDAFHAILARHQQQIVLGVYRLVALRRNGGGFEKAHHRLGLVDDLVAHCDARRKSHALAGRERDLPGIGDESRRALEHVDEFVLASLVHAQRGRGARRQLGGDDREILQARHRAKTAFYASTHPLLEL